MKFILDMVHDNPGEERTKTAFRDPKKLVEYGFNGQVFKHINTVVTFEKECEDFFEEKGGHEWLKKMQYTVISETSSAKKAGLMSIYHIDLFVLPKLLIEKYKSDICDENGKISIFREKTKELHRMMFDEIFEKYQVDGLIIRIGETYLHDTPYYGGNGAVAYGNDDDEKRTLVELINFLKDEICIKHRKYLIFRTWDCFPDKFHASKEYYLDVTDKITPFDKLFFAIKYTKLDFWRRVKFNPCIGCGKHKQIIEIQCQREYEGKGAYPMYVMDDVISGGRELKERKGLKDVVDNSLFRGIFSWSRGGGWYGPYIKNEFWCDLNTYILSKYAQTPKRAEKEIFIEYARIKMGMDEGNAKKFHEICKKASEAVLCGRYIEAYDLSLNEDFMPCENWIRDDRIGGLRQLDKVFDFLEENNLVEAALAEKKKSLDLWKEIKADFEKVELDNVKMRSFIENSIDYAITFYTIINISFNIFAKCRKKKVFQICCKSMI